VKYKIPCLQMNQYQIGPGGAIKPPETRQILTKIDTIEFPKWEFKVMETLSGRVLSWINVWGVTLGFVLVAMSCFKHALVCHNCSYYKKRETDRNNNKILDVPLLVYFSRKICSHYL